NCSANPGRDSGPAAVVAAEPRRVPAPVTSHSAGAAPTNPSQQEADGRPPSRSTPNRTGTTTPATSLSGTTTESCPLPMPRNRNATPIPVPTPDSAPHPSAPVVTDDAGTTTAAPETSAVPPSCATSATAALCTRRARSEEH